MKKFISMHQLMVVIFCMVLAGCRVHFVKEDNPIYPNVIPDPHQFVLNFTVKNGSNRTYEDKKVIANIDVNYRTDYSQDPCIYYYSIPLNRLEPDQIVVFESHKFDDDAPLGHPCRCMKGSCQGRIVLSLKTAGGESFTGSGTKYQITWKKSGNLEDVSVVSQD